MNAVKYNPFSEEVMRDPHPTYRRLRDESPVHHLEEYDAWALSRFADVWDACMDADCYSTAQGTSPSHLLTRVQPVTPMLNLMDPPAHTVLRARLRGHFSPRTVAALEPRLRELVRGTLDAFAAKGAADLVGDFAVPVASTMACMVAGFPVEDGAMLGRLVQRFFAREPGVDGMTPDGLAAATEMNQYFEQMVRARRARPTDRRDPLAELLEVEIEGERFDDTAMASHLAMLLIGGAETFPKVFANAVYRLFEHPDQRAALAADPGRIPDAFTEVLRYDMPTQFLCRTLLRDVKLHGETLRAGRPVLFLYASANRDEREFPDPDRFDVGRRSPRILSFGHGTHACLGIHVARLEGRLALEEILARIPEYTVEVDRVERLRTEFVQGFASMPVRFEPA